MRMADAAEAATARRGGDADDVLETVQRACAGDSGALGELYERFAGSVYGLARSVVRDEHDAEDITQQVFLKLLTSLSTFQRSRGSFHAWLLRITHNAAIDHVRRRRPIPAEEIFAPDAVARDHRSPVTDAVVGAISDLPGRQRRAIALLHLGLPPAEVAQVMGVSEAAVYVLHHRARRRLCTELGRQGIGPSTRRAAARRNTLAPAVSQS